MTNLFPKFSAKVMTVILTCHLFPASIFSQPSGVGIGTTTVEQSAILDVTSTDKGVLVPRLTTAQRIGVLTPAAGLLVYDSDYNSFWYFDGNSWDELTKETNNTDEQTLSFNSPDLSISNGNTVDLSSLATNDGDWVLSGNNIYSGNTGNVGIFNIAPIAPLHVGSGNTSTSIGFWDGSNHADIDLLLPGSAYGSLIQGGDNGHLVIGIRDDEIKDAFSIVSGSGDFMTTDSLFDNVVLYAQADGNVGICTTEPVEKLDVNLSLIHI